MSDFSFVPGQDGQPKLVLTAPDGARAEVYQFGSHVTSWIPAGGREQLFLSEKAVIGGSVSIRGGTPICFPQFSGLGSLPKHGIVRTSPWQLVEQGIRDGQAFARLEFSDNETTQSLWPYPFRTSMTITLGGPKLSMQLDIFNTGESAFSFTGALHTYFHVDEISQTRLDGLGGRDYNEYAGGGVPKPSHQDLAEIQFDGGEVDRVYAGTMGPFVIREPGRALQIESAGFPDCVVWNPGPELCSRLKDMALDGYHRMLCVESAVVTQPVVLAPGQQWRGAQILTARQES